MTRVDNIGVSHHDGGKLVIPERKAVHSFWCDWCLIGASRVVRVETHPECS